MNGEELIETSSNKIIYRYFGKSNSSIVIDFSKNKSKEYFGKNKLEGISQYELYREINRYLYIKNKSNGCSVPEIYTTDDEKYMLEIEDLGDDFLKDIGYTYNIYRDLVRWLGYLHKLYSSKDVLKFIRKRKYDEGAISEELFDLVLYSSIPNIETIAENLLEKINGIPLNICHRDFQSDNILIDCHKPYVIGFQDMCIGPITFDLASLLYDPKVKISEEDINGLISLYSLLIGYPYDKVKKWTKACGKLYLLKIAGRHYKRFSDTKKFVDKDLADLAIEKFNKL